MKVTKLNSEDFRNLNNIQFCPCENMNVIYGDNAQGKTNLLEAIYLFTGIKSFRGAKDKEFVAFDKKYARLHLEFETKRRQQNADLIYGISKKEKIMELNGVKLKTPSEFFGNFRCVVFSPDFLNFVKGSPELRRKFIDTAVAQIRKNYIRTLQKYNKALLQRNNIIKNYQKYNNLNEILYSWDLQLAKNGAYLTVLRLDYLKRLKSVASTYYESMTSGKEKLEITYNSPMLSHYDKEIEYNAELIEYYLSRQQSMTKVDIKLGYTLNGIHRDDLTLTLNNKPLKTYGSQGQQRSAVLALKLAEAYILQFAFEEEPVMLFDDVLSELDTNRQRFLLNNIKDMQTIITCCDKNSLKLLEKGKIFKMQNGILTER